MKIIIEIYGIIMMLMLTMQTGLSVVSAQECAAQAKRYKAAVIAEVENSNFNPTVIASCIRKASESGYALTITTATYDGIYDIETADVELTYSYRMPLLGIEQSRTTKGIAR